MTVYQAIFLAVVQGLTEFFPVSSSGHLVLLQKFFRITKPPVFFDVLLHFGTLVAVLFFLKKEILFLFQEWKNKISLGLLLVIGSIPATVFGLLLNSRLDAVFGSLFLVGLCWIINGILLLLTKKFAIQKAEELKDVKRKDALTIGLFQAAALFPGISRSGSTIFGGLLCKFSPKLAFSFSFLLSVPVILGATFLELKSDSLTQVDLFLGVPATIIAGIVGYFSLGLLKRALVSEKLFYFGYYCLVLGIAVLVFSFK